MTPNRKTLIVLGVAALLVACAVGIAAIISPGAPRTPQPLATPPRTPQPSATPTPAPTPDIQTVPDDNGEVYLLSRLEEVKDFLTDYMAEYSILVLDADQLTNRVDVCLKAYTEENMEQIRALVRDHYPDMDGCLNFEDYSGIIISFTADQEPATP